MEEARKRTFRPWPLLHSFYKTILSDAMLEFSVYGANKCYSCGYRKNGLEGEMQEMEGVAFCNDFANPTDFEVTCEVESDCCASYKEVTEKLVLSVILTLFYLLQEKTLVPSFKKYCC